MKTTRVIQWATGPVGSVQLAEVIDNPEFDLVGVFVYSPDKVGVDAGALVGRPDTGIVATNDKAAILALDADVVLHSASKAYGFDANTDDIVALLETGKSVITVTSYAHLPTLGSDVSERIRKACAAGNSRFSSTLPSWPTDWCTRPSLGGRVRQRRWFARGRGRAPRFMTRKASTSGTVHQDPSRRESGPPGRALSPTGAPWCRPRRVAVAAPVREDK